MFGFKWKKYNILLLLLLLTDVPHNTCTQQIHFENFNEELFLQLMYI